MAEKKIKWTEQQKRAIDARGSDVLVTASAGTGKTAVLSRRCAGIVSDKSICPDVGCLLVLTFTEAAAEQMRWRIADQLRQAYFVTRDSHLRRQLILLQGADISTIHSFCKRLITEYFYRLDLDPAFTVIDGDEQKLLKSEVLERTIDRAWQQSDIRADLERLLYRRDLRTNDGFLTKIAELSDLLDGVISRERWCQRAARPAPELNERQKQIVAARLQSVLSRLDHCQRLVETEGGDTGWALKLQESHVEPVAQCVKMLKAGDWDKCAETIRNFNKPTTPKPKDFGESTAALIQSTARGAIDAFAELSQLATINPDYFDRLGDSVALQTKVLVELVKGFDQLYTQAKLTLNCLDFADLEHYALRLLTSEGSSQDEPSPSATALALRQRYKHIFVDEYQDINSVQQRILRMLGPGGNILGVGDGKQSIYAFRGAKPDIFLDQVKLASLDPADVRGGLRVDLNVNFRSAKGILDFVNAIFSRTMTASFTKIDYDESAQLRPGLTSAAEHLPASKENIVEFHILDEEKTDNTDTQYDMRDAQYETSLVTGRRRQAAIIARRIRQMVGADTGKPQFQIHDTEQDAPRDVDYRDIVVLMRSLAKKANDYVEVLRLAGVPVSCQATAGYFEATEISDMLCLLKVLDNPQRDIEVAAVLRSPFFEVSDIELAKIRIHSEAKHKRSDFHDCVLEYSETGTDAGLAARLKEILDRIDGWRTIARRGNLADLIWRIYRQTSYLSFVSALPSGQARRANLLKLHDRAIQFEGFASSAAAPSLTRFVEFVEKLQAVGQDWAPAEPQDSGGNAVRILSVHKSKGLEFPVVFLAELESKFNKRDSQADCLADADEALGLQIIDRETNSKLSSLAHEVIAEQKEAMSLAEEMRILYVATTRAKDRLVLTASQKRSKCREIVSNGFFLGGGPVPDWQLRACRSPLEWILCGLSDRKILHDALETHLAERAGGDDLFSFELHSQADLKELSEFVIALKSRRSARRRSKKSRPTQAESKLLAQIKESLAWRYRFGNAPLLPAKSSVTQLTHGNDEYMKFDYSGVLERRPRVLTTAEPRIGERPDARLIGTATHLVISELDLAEPVTEEAIEKTKEKLLADDAMAPTVAEHIDTESILAFFSGELGGLTLDKSNAIWREWPFTFALDTGESVETNGETVIVQGIIDVLVRTSDGLVIIDFKTDRVTSEQVTERSELYRGQLELYGKAACAILGADSVKRWLYFLTPGCAVEV
ncbi:MAG: helicase-exonuclease AddAB subunit AddA [Phycisphaerae bacterium]|nr:helicase-exonuclease AddAB subunit AddA [Phycisphaerae bacterium]